MRLLQTTIDPFHATVQARPPSIPIDTRLQYIQASKQSVPPHLLRPLLNNMHPETINLFIYTTGFLDVVTLQ